jgi:hypothetical protein
MIGKGHGKEAFIVYVKGKEVRSYPLNWAG